MISAQTHAPLTPILRAEPIGISDRATIRLRYMSRAN